MSGTSTRWSANVISDGAAQLWYFLDGRPIMQTVPGGLDLGTPEQHLLLAAAGCYALSCRDVLAQGHRQRHPFEVVATADKTAGNPLPQLALTCIFASDLSSEQAEQVTDAAQRQCAGSGTWLGSAGVSFQVRVLHPSLRDLARSCAQDPRLPAGAPWPTH